MSELAEADTTDIKISHVSTLAAAKLATSYDATSILWRARCAHRNRCSCHEIIMVMRWYCVEIATRLLLMQYCVLQAVTPFREYVSPRLAGKTTRKTRIVNQNRTSVEVRFWFYPERG